jgi:ADP-ribose pyrophosphatase YjhB (NUDIX family)
MSNVNSIYDEMHPHGIPQENNTQPFCQIYSSQVIQVSACGILNSKGQILVGFNLKRQVWDIPQGVIELNETYLEGIIRELEEEIGIKTTHENFEYISMFRQYTKEFIKPWETHLYLLKHNDITNITNCEPTKCEKLAWYAPVQLPGPRGLSLRILLNLLGY